MRKIRLDHIGPTVRARRIEAGMSQEALAQTIGVTRQTVSRLERDASDSTISTLANALRALDLSIFVLEPTESRQTTPLDASLNRAPDQMAALALARLAPDLGHALGQLPSMSVPQEDLLALSRVFDDLPQISVGSEKLNELSDALKKAREQLGSPMPAALESTLAEMRRAVLAGKEQAS